MAAIRAEQAGLAVGPGGRWTLHEAREDSDAQLLALFAEAFGHDIPLAQWRWKYADAPLRGLLLRKEGRPVAFFGGMPRAMHGPEGLLQAVQNGDVMVAPAERAVFTREGALYQVAAAFFERMVGPGRPYALAFGFPSDRHTRLGVRLGLYQGGPRMRTLRWTPDAAGPGLWRAARPLEPGELQRLDPLAQAMPRQWPGQLLPVRGAARWRYRFLAHPVHRHALLAVRRRWGGQLLCALALRLHADRVDWLDYIGPPGEVPHAVAAARAFAAGRGQPLTALVSEPLAPLFGARAAGNEPAMQVALALRSEPLALRTPAWLMGGDTDFL